MCKEIRDQFFADHTGLESWYHKVEAEGKRFGYVTSLDGRRRHVPNLRIDASRGSDARKKYEETRREAINSVVQGFGSDLKLMSLIEIDERIDESRGWLIGEVHDSIVIECDEDYAYEVAALAISIMRHPRLLDVLGIKMQVPIDADAKIGISLGEAKEVEIPVEAPAFRHGE
jgi:DNA polymerase-1